MKRGTKTMNALDKIISAAKAEEKALPRLKLQYESKAVRWEYWGWPYWHWNPEEVFKSEGYIAKPTSKDKSLYDYGYDKHGRVIVIRYGRGWGKNFDNAHHHFLRYSGNKLTGIEYRGLSPWMKFEATLDGNQVVRLERSGAGVHDELKTITWNDGKVHKVVTHDREPLGAIITEVTYDTRGKVISDVDLSEVEEEKPLPKGVTLKTQAKEIRKRLVEAVVKTLTKLKLKQPVYCLALNYDCEGNPILPPMLAIGLDSERQARLKKGGKDAKLDIWEPEQMSLFAKEKTDEVISDDKKLQEACDYYNRLLEKQGDNAPAHKLLNEIAAELCRMNWKGKLNTTVDFIAYAVDTDLADLQKNLKQSVPADRLKKLKAAKML